MSGPKFKVDRAHFAANFPSGGLYGAKLGTGARKAGFDAIFDAWDTEESYDFPAWLAYALATAWHETQATMQPVREHFAKSDAAAFASVSDYCRKKGIANYAARHSNGHSYYGRGYVQLTHAENYRKMGKHLGVGSLYYDQPDRVMEAKTAAVILLEGILHGLFRPSKGTLLDYFNAKAARWYDARELINGDKDYKPPWAKGPSHGTIIGGYGKAFLSAIRLG